MVGALRRPLSEVFCGRWAAAGLGWAIEPRRSVLMICADSESAGLSRHANGPAILIFDVNETLLDIEVMKPVFRRVFGEERALREWFNALVMYSMTATLSGKYETFFCLARG